MKVFWSLCTVTFWPSAHGGHPFPLRHADVLDGWSQNIYIHTSNANLRIFLPNFAWKIKLQSPSSKKSDTTKMTSHKRKATNQKSKKNDILLSNNSLTQRLADTLSSDVSSRSVLSWRSWQQCLFRYSVISGIFYSIRNCPFW